LACFYVGGFDENIICRPYYKDSKLEINLDNVHLANYFHDFLTGRISILYIGKIVEEADAYEIIDNPLHAYNRALSRLHKSIGKWNGKSSYQGKHDGFDFRNDRLQVKK